MIHDLLQQTPGPVTEPVIARITKLVRKAQGGEGERVWQFQAIKLEDASGSIEAKVWNKPDVTVGADMEFGLNTQGTGLTIEQDPKYGRKLIVQDSATMVPHGGGPPPYEAPLPQQPAGSPLPDSGIPGLPQPTASAYQPPPPPAEKNRDKIILENANIVIRAYESVIKHVVPQVQEKAGYEMSGDEIRAAVESITIYSQKDLRA